MRPAAGFIHFGCTYNNYGVTVTGRFSVHQSLGPAGRSTAYHADGLKFVNVLRFGHQNRYAAKGLGPEICVQTGNDYADASGDQFIDNIQNGIIQELGLVKPYNSCIRFQIG
jgi:hypothetical protein